MNPLIFPTPYNISSSVVKRDIADFLDSKVFDEEFPEASQEVIRKFDDLEAGRISKESFIDEIRDVLVNCDDKEVLAFLNLAAKALPKEVEFALRSEYQKPSLLKTAVVVLLYLLSPVASKGSSCDGLSVKVDGRKYDPNGGNPGVEQACKVVKEMRGNLRAPVEFVTATNDLESGAFNPVDEKITLSLQKPSKTNVKVVRDTLRHENQHAKIFAENKIYAPNELPSANPCLLTTNKAKCEAGFVSVYDKLDKLHTLSPSQIRQFQDLASRVAGSTFSFAMTSPKDQVQRTFGKENVEFEPIKGGHRVVVTIPRDENNATTVLANCLANLKGLDLGPVYAKKWPLSTPYGRERMAAEIEGKLVGHLGEKHARELLGVFEPDLKGLLDARDYSIKSSDL